MNIGHLYLYLLTRHDVPQFYLHDVPCWRTVVASKTNSSPFLLMFLKLFLSLFLGLDHSLGLLPPKTDLKVMDSCLGIDGEDVLNSQRLFWVIGIDLLKLNEGKTITQFNIIGESSEGKLDFLVAWILLCWRESVASSFGFGIVCHYTCNYE